MFQIYSKENLPLELWEELAGESLLYSTGWLNLWRTLGGEPVYFISDQSAGDYPLCGFAGIRFGDGAISRIQVQANGLPGRLFPDYEAKKANADIIEESLACLARSSGLYAIWVDYDNVIKIGHDNDNALSEHWRRSEQVCHRILLADESNQFDSKTRRHIRSGIERGATVRPIATADEAQICFELQTETYKRRGARVIYNKKFYHELFELSQKDQRIIWLVCETDGKLIGSSVTLVEREEALNWQPYIDWESRRYKQSYLLMEESIREARKRNLKIFNLGATPAGAEGLRIFKEGFGASSYAYSIYRYDLALGRILKTVGLIRS
ncbi:MAG: GNAT family N-acetyltransferase [candidate division Zixibacteria bacterium]|nr:GNAT family N-acetyltransferase [candidate division Zixibacteria bacterium]